MLITSAFRVGQRGMPIACPARVVALVDRYNRAAWMSQLRKSPEHSGHEVLNQRQADTRVSLRSTGASRMRGDAAFASVCPFASRAVLAELTHCAAPRLDPRVAHAMQESPPTEVRSLP